MENNFLLTSKGEAQHYKELITERFLGNPRMALLYDKGKPSFRSNVSSLVNYCYTIAERLNGVYVAKNKKSIVLFYEKKRFRKTLGDFFRYLRVARGIPLSNIGGVLRREKLIDKNKMQLDNYLYVWFIAQDAAYTKLDGLIEINTMLSAYAQNIGLPILFETSDKRLLRFYKHAGFDLYKTLEVDHETIYFYSKMNP